MKALFRKFFDFENETEFRGTLWATAYGFTIMFSYYILRAVRDEISSADRGNLQILWTAVFLVMLVAVPLYSWLTSRMGRARFVPWANRFFILNLIAFWACLVFLPEGARPWIDRVFYVWDSVFALFVVSVFWGFIADCFDNSQGKRLFSFIAVGSSIGGLAGSAVTSVLAEYVPTFSLLLIACVPLEVASWCALALHRMFGTGNVRSAGESAKPVPGNAWTGFKAVAQSRYLTGIALFILLMTFCSTVLYFQQASLLGEAISDRGERTAFLARMDLAVNLITIIFQVYLTARFMKWFGVGVVLLSLPAIIAAGFIWLGFTPTLAVLVVVQVAYRAGRYGLTKPAREVLWTVLRREDKYKAKPFLDAAIYRGGDLVSGWIYTGLTALGLTIGAISLIAAPIAIVWALLGLGLGRRQERMAQEQRGGEQTGEPLAGLEKTA